MMASETEGLAWTHTPESSNVAKIAFDGPSRAIYVEFKNGSVYRYNDCSHDLWHSFVGSDSKGKFVHSALKSHPTERVS